jgi:hypothetical protein
MRVARGWMNSVREDSSPDDTTDTTGETAARKPGVNSWEPWWGTLSISDSRSIRPARVLGQERLLGGVVEVAGEQHPDVPELEAEHHGVPVDRVGGAQRTRLEVR